MPNIVDINTSERDLRSAGEAPGSERLAQRNVHVGFNRQEEEHRGRPATRHAIMAHGQREIHPNTEPDVSRDFHTLNVTVKTSKH